MSLNSRGRLLFTSNPHKPMQYIIKDIIHTAALELRKPNLKAGYRKALKTGYRRALAELGRPDPLASRGRLSDHIRKVAQDGKIGVIVTSTDCDHCTSSYTAVISATVLGFKRLEDGAYDNAEGPVSVIIVSPAEADAHEPIWHDGIAAAHENGHPHSVVAF